MKIAEKVYQTSGLPFGTNSNTFCIDTRDGLVMIDAGFSEKQYRIMEKQLETDGLGKRPFGKLFLTHCHFDHAGNARRLQEQGAKVCMAAEDAMSTESGGQAVLEELFGRKFRIFAADVIVEDGQTFDCGDVCITVLAHPGHTRGTISLLAEVEKKKILFTGDIFVMNGCTPADELQVEAGWNGSPDYNDEKNLETLQKLRELPPLDMVAPGHGSIYLGDSRDLFETLYQTVKRNK